MCKAADTWNKKQRAERAFPRVKVRKREGPEGGLGRVEAGEALVPGRDQAPADGGGRTWVMVAVAMPPTTCRRFG